MPDRYILHASPGAASGDLFVADEPLGAGRFQWLLASNAAHCARRNACRILATHGGFQDITGTVAYPAVSTSLGTHHVTLYPGSAQYPVLHLSGRAWCTGGATLTVALAVYPGESRSSELGATGTYTSATGEDINLTVPLSRAHVAPITLAPTAGYVGTTPTEQGEAMMFRAYLIAYASAKGGFAAGLSLHLGPPA